jgi:hypothetical protein
VSVASYTLHVTDEAPAELNSVDTALGSYEVVDGRITTDSAREAALLGEIHYLEAGDGFSAEDAEDPAAVQQREFNEAHDIDEEPAPVEVESSAPFDFGVVETSESEGDS